MSRIDRKNGADLSSSQSRRNGKLCAVTGAVLMLLLSASFANAFVFELGGVSPESGNPTGALYFHSRDGRETMLAEVDVHHDGLPTLADLGQPSVADDGSIVFGGMVFENRRPHWILFRSEPGASPRRVSRILIPDSGGAFPPLVLNVDPRPAVDSEGGVIFMARAASDREAIFRIFDGEVSRLVGTGDKTADGRRLTHVAFGSVNSWGPGECVFVGWLEHDKQAELAFSRAKGLRVLAAEGDNAPGGGVFKRNFGLPAAVSQASGSEDALVSFTARTSVGEGLFLHAAKLQQISLEGVPFGKTGACWLSTGRPGLAAPGRIALMAQCNKRPVIIGIDRSGRREILARTDTILESGSVITNIADPWILDSGAILFGGSRDTSWEALYQLSSYGVIDDLSKPGQANAHESDTSDIRAHTVCAVTMSPNRYGDFAYLGSR